MKHNISSQIMRPRSLYKILPDATDAILLDFAEAFDKFTH